MSCSVLLTDRAMTGVDDVGLALGYQPVNDAEVYANRLERPECDPTALVRS